MFVFHPLSEPTRRSLIDGGLDPDAVAGIVRNAVTEDLMGGVDVTSAATIPSITAARPPSALVRMA
jgi:nicotinate-nucleotide pyrophosphorylase (carboxylating)